MASTAVFSDDSTAVVTGQESRFHWGIVIAGAFAASATTFFLLTLGAGIGLALVPEAHAKTATVFFTMGAIYFLASEAFGFAVGGYLVGRLIGPEVENSEEEEFRAGAHGLVMWALAVVAGLLLIVAASGVTGSSVAGAIAPRSTNPAAETAYWVDMMFGARPNVPQVMADKAEARRILSMNSAGHVSDGDTERLTRLVAEDDGSPMAAANSRVTDVEARWASAANDARKAASITALWTAFALLFGLFVAVAATISARWMDDRITFGWKPRR